MLLEEVNSRENPCKREARRQGNWFWNYKVQKPITSLLLVLGLINIVLNVNVSSGHQNKWLDDIFLNCPTFEQIKFALGVDFHKEPSPGLGIYMTAKLWEPQDRSAAEMNHYFVFQKYVSLTHQPSWFSQHSV